VSKDDLTLLSSSPVSSSLSSITNASEGRSSTRYTTALGGSPVAYSRTNTFNSSTVSHTNSMGTTFSDSNSSITESSVLSDESVMMREKEMDAALVSHLHAGRSMSVEQVYASTVAASIAATRPPSPHPTRPVNAGAAGAGPDQRSHVASSQQRVEGEVCRRAKNGGCIDALAAGTEGTANSPKNDAYITAHRRIYN
jgi:hypothetical protein